MVKRYFNAFYFPLNFSLNGARKPMPIAHKAYGLYRTVFDKWAHDVAERIKKPPNETTQRKKRFLGRYR
ncbi:MAG: hypothetical protein CME80_00360 [Halomonas sp.]|nr:hypothetical protein [Halomonas sp.]